MPRYRMRIERSSSAQCEVDLIDDEAAKEFAKKLFAWYSPNVPVISLEHEHNGVELKAHEGNGRHHVVLHEMTDTGCLKRWLDVWTK